MDFPTGMHNLSQRHSSFCAESHIYCIYLCFIIAVLYLCCSSGGRGADEKFGGSGIPEAGERNQSGRGKRESEPRGSARDRRVSASHCHAQGTLKRGARSMLSMFNTAVSAGTASL